MICTNIYWHQIDLDIWEIMVFGIPMMMIRRHIEHGFRIIVFYNIIKCSIILGDFKGKEKTIMYDYLIVGAGLYGAVFAHEAKKHGKSVLVIDRRPNIAGMAFSLACLMNLSGAQTINHDKVEMENGKNTGMCVNG